ncbi:MAG: glycosyltransferase family 2 protein [Candidatus Auribacterota bacterium]|jgi:GT2 family glycosyltransferase|nr:glycosyltransferase family 2 protein [Candidatus Auribacterota bacterium]
MNEKKPAVSVIIPNWNGEEYIIPCLRSVFASTFDSFEVVVVDNGSTDDSVFIIEEKYPEVKIIRFDQNTGFAVACNAGIRESGGEYIFLLNNDIELEPDCISYLVNALREHADYAMATGKILNYYDRRKIDAAGDSLTVGGAPYNRGHGLLDSGQLDTEGQVFGVCAGAALYRRSLFEQIGYFDEDFFAYMEDVDLNLRAGLLGYKAYYTPLARCYHHASATFGAFSRRHVYLTNRNKVFVILKYFRLGWLFRHITDLIGHQVKMAELFSSTHRGLSFFRSRLAIILKTPRMILKRHRFLMKHKPDWDTAYSLLEKPRE